MKKELYLWSDFDRDCELWKESFDFSKYDTIYGVPRGGTCLAVRLSSLVNLPIVAAPKESTLIVDDIIDSGATRKKFINWDFIALHKREGSSEIALHESNNWIVYPWESEQEVAGEDIVIRQLEFIGEDSLREGLLKTPQRVVRSWEFLFSGYNKDPKDIFTTFDANGYDEMVLLKNIEMYSICEHHLLPFLGKAHIAYIPDGRVIGVSKLARLLEIYSRRLQIQERICEQITEDLMSNLFCKGAACIIEASHLCMRMRGVEKQNSVMTTSSLKGVFLTNSGTRQELLSLIK